MRPGSIRGRVDLGGPVKVRLHLENGSDSRLRRAVVGSGWVADRDSYRRRSRSGRLRRTSTRSTRVPRHRPSSGCRSQRPRWCSWTPESRSPCAIRRVGCRRRFTRTPRMPRGLREFQRMAAASSAIGASTLSHCTCDERRWLVGPPATLSCHGIPAASNHPGALLASGRRFRARADR